MKKITHILGSLVITIVLVSIPILETIGIIFKWHPLIILIMTFTLLIECIDLYFKILDSGE